MTRSSPDVRSLMYASAAGWVSIPASIPAGQLYDAEGIVTADCDRRETLHAKRHFDVAGPYGRADVLAPGSV